jgi:hypothetical protein
MYLSEDKKVYWNVCMESFAQKEFFVDLSECRYDEIMMTFQSPLPIICCRNMQRPEEM